jgi:hypothetical protein
MNKRRVARRVGGKRDMAEGVVLEDQVRVRGLAKRSLLP